MIKPAHLAYRRLTKAGRLALACDFDGTVAEIVDDPNKAQILPIAAEALESLAQRGAADVAIVTGRSLADIRERVGIESLDYVGCSGLELIVGGRVIQPPNADELRDRMSSIALTLEQSLEGTGARVENKGLTVALHWRETPAAEKSVRRALRGLEASDLATTPGKMVLELGPTGHRGKGDGVRTWQSALGEIGNQVLVYMGDDVVDEDAFKFVRRLGGVTIYVGGGGKTAAEFRIRSPQEIARFLQALAEVRAPFPETG